MGAVDARQCREEVAAAEVVVAWGQVLHFVDFVLALTKVVEFDCLMYSMVGWPRPERLLPRNGAQVVMAVTEPSLVCCYGAVFEVQHPMVGAFPRHCYC